MSILNFQKTISDFKRNVYIGLVDKIIKNKASRKFLCNKLDKSLYQDLVEKRGDHELKAVQKKKYDWTMAVVEQILKNYEKGWISSNVYKTLLRIAAPKSFSEENYNSIQKAKKRFEEKYEMGPPSFILVAPTQVCNLNCKGCYAASSADTAVSIPFDTFDRILKENHDIFGNRFVVISGGEPLMYKSQGKNLLDIFEKYNDTFFLFFTNGTLITKEVASRLEKLGNVIPQISIEGFKEETDERRGKGTFDKILQAIENLQEKGVPYTVSITATKNNVDLLLGEEFYRYWFEEKGATYMWSFQFMPIGRGEEVFDLMPTAEQRLKLFRRWEELLENRYPVADFWNSGILVSGCIAYGRTSGYFYIDWNGNITPCVFVPYYVDNVYELYKEGETLEDAWNSNFFKAGRKWQMDYGYPHPRQANNWLMPCSIRDHYENFRKNILVEDAKAEDEFAKKARESEEYYKNLVKYDQRLEKLTQPIWEEEYKKEE